MVKIIRDGLSTNPKSAMQKPKNFKTDDYKDDMFLSVVNIYEIYKLTGTTSRAKYLKDPYGIYMLLKPHGIDLGDKLATKSAEIPEITCKEYFDLVEAGDIDTLLEKLTVREQVCCHVMGTGHKLPQLEVIKSIAVGIGANLDEAIDTWTIQPDPASMAFGLASERAVLESVTPVIGIPLKPIVPTDIHENVRFPATISPYLYQHLQIHIHKDEDFLKVFDIDGNLIDIDKDLVDELKEIGMSYVVEGFLIGYPDAHDTWIQITDILCWNDIWLYRRPWAERVNMLWRFAEWTDEVFFVKNAKQMKKMLEESGEILVRNLNSPYNPLKFDTHIHLHVDQQTVVLEVSQKKGRSKSMFLKTSDGKYLFEINKMLDKREKGGTVEVKRDGTIIRRMDGISPDRWREVSAKWGLPEDFKSYPAKIPIAKWLQEKNDGKMFTKGRLF